MVPHAPRSKTRKVTLKSKGTTFDLIKSRKNQRIFWLYQEGERQGPDRRQPFLENAELFNLFTVSWPRKEGPFTRVFLRRGPLSRQHPENE